VAGFRPVTYLVDTQARRDQSATVFDHMGAGINLVGPLMTYFADDTAVSLGPVATPGGASDGRDETVATVGQRAPASRFRLSSTPALNSFTLRSVELQYEPSG